MHVYKHSINEFAEALGGIVTSLGNGVKVPHPFDEARNILVYPNRDIRSGTAFFVQITDDERIELKRHIGEILKAAGIDARETGVNEPAPAPDPEIIPIYLVPEPRIDAEIVS